MAFIISTVWIALEILHYYSFTAAFLPRKASRKTEALFCIVFCALALIYTNVQWLVPFKVPLLFVSLLTMKWRLFEGPWLKSIIILGMAYLFPLLVDTAAIYGVSAILSVSLSQFIWMKMYYTVTVCITKLMTLFLSWNMYRYSKANGFGCIRGKWLFLTCIFPVISIVLVAFLFYMGMENGDLSGGVAGICLVLTVANVAILRVITALEKSAVQEREALMIKQQMEQQAANIANYERSFQAQRQLIHEFQHHIQTLNGLHQEGDTEHAAEYLQKLANDRSIRLFSINTNHPVFDVILNQKHQLSQEKGIDMQIKVNDLSAVRLPSEQLVVILTNLLDNAIEACCKVEGPREIVCTVLHEDSLFISVKNSSLPVEVYDGGIPTTKADILSHGYGIKSITTALKTLGGEYSFGYADGSFLFVMEIPCSK